MIQTVNFHTISSRIKLIPIQTLFTITRKIIETNTTILTNSTSIHLIQITFPTIKIVTYKIPFHTFSICERIQILTSLTIGFRIEISCTTIIKTLNFTRSCIQFAFSTILFKTVNFYLKKSIKKC